MTFVIIRQIKQSSVSHSLLCLFDSGATTSWIHRHGLPKGCHGQTGDSITNGTMPGTFTSDQAVLHHEITFPEFSSSITYEEMSAHIFHSPCSYDIVFGQDECRLLGIHLNFEDNLIEFIDQTLLMKEYPSNANLSTSKL